MEQPTNSKILTEAGTNEVELLSFRCEGQPFAINVAKVREVIRLPKIVEVPNADYRIDGVFSLRGTTIPVISVRRWLGCEDRPTQENDRVIVTEFNQQWYSFRVDSVDRIYLLTWEKIKPSPLDAMGGLSGGECVTAVAEIGEELALLLDFERVVNEIAPNEALNVGTVEDRGTVVRKEKRLLLAEDSATIRRLLENTLTNSGYTQLHVCHDGQAAWETLEQLAEQVSTKEELTSHVNLMITDIEMPRMDGLHLVSRIKSHAALQHLPVVIFSSLISDENRKKGDAVGADAQISKPEIAELVETVDRLIL